MILEKITEHREPIQRFYGASSIDHISLFNFLNDQYKKHKKETFILDATYHEKIDGFFFQFGMFEGEFFIQSSYSDMAFEETYKKVFYKSYMFLDIFEKMLDDRELQKSLRILNLKYGSFKIKSEILFAPFEDEHDIQIGTIQYNKKLFGKSGLIVLFGSYKLVSKEWIKNNEILNFIKSTFFNFKNNDELYHELSLEISIKSLIQYFEHEYNKSLFHLQNETLVGQLIKSDLDSVAQEMQKKLDQLADETKYVMTSEGMPGEGLILTCGGRLFKGTTLAYTKNREAWWHFFEFFGRCRSQLDKIVDDASKNSFKAQKNTIIQHIFDNKIENYLEYQKYIKNYEIKLDFSKYAQEILSIKSKFYDILKKIYIIKEKISKNLYERYKIECLKLIKYINYCFFNFNQEQNIILYYLKLENVIKDYEEIKQEADLWIGRAQPWHKGHHSMIDQKRNTIIHLVGSKIDEENPLHPEDKLSFISHLYENNKNIWVNPWFTENGYIPAVLGTLFSAPFVVSRIICGSDRKESYQKQIDDIDQDYFELINGYKIKNIEVVEKDREFSGTQVRYRAVHGNYDDFKSSCYTNINVDDNILLPIYNKLRNQTADIQYVQTFIKKNDQKRKIRDIIII